MQALESRPDIVWWTDRMTAVTLAERLASDDPPLVLDVRPAAEWAEKRIEGSLNIPLDRLAERVHEFPRDHKIVVFCDTGYCSSVAASLLQQCGLSGVTHLVGGLDAWETAKLRTAASPPAQT
jgi:rhodanese-related sulfurtransferase